ncbi:MAG: Clp protease N-terminal domain-containing protein, partial [Anaerolineae bacterium]|nr:Clp protease N-terminal domain-containing protein [Anaerolineae bacterium]
MEINAASSAKDVSDPAFRLAGTAHTALFFALAEAKRMQHSSANTAHLLLGLLTDEWGAAGRILRSLGLGSQQVLALVEQTSVSHAVLPERPRFAPDAIMALGTNG